MGKDNREVSFAYVLSLSLVSLHPFSSVKSA